MAASSPREFPLLAPIEGRLAWCSGRATRSEEVVAAVHGAGGERGPVPAASAGAIRWRVELGAEVVAGQWLGTLVWEQAVRVRQPRSGWSLSALLPTWRSTGWFEVAAPFVRFAASSVQLAFCFYVLAGGDPFRWGWATPLFLGTFFAQWLALGGVFASDSSADSEGHRMPCFELDPEPPAPAASARDRLPLPLHELARAVRFAALSEVELAGFARHPDPTIAAFAAARLAAAGDTDPAWALTERPPGFAADYGYWILGRWGNGADLERLIREQTLVEPGGLAQSIQTSVAQLSRTFPDRVRPARQAARQALERQRVAGALRRQLPKGATLHEDFRGVLLPSEETGLRMGRATLDLALWAPAVLLFGLIDGLGGAIGIAALFPIWLLLRPSYSLQSELQKRADQKLLASTGWVERSPGSLALSGLAGEGALAAAGTEFSASESRTGSGLAQ